MEKHNQHNSHYKATEELLNEYLSKSEVGYSRSKEDVWAGIEHEMRFGKPELPVRRINFRAVISLAAISLLLLGLFSIVRFYTVTVSTQSGEFYSHSFSDGSVIEMSGNSMISYQPYMFWYSRDVEFEGKAFFAVEKGNRFRVVSSNGTTQVLGTSFTINAKEEEYKVACITGMVKVISKAGQEVVLNPQHEAEINFRGQIVVTKTTTPAEPGGQEVFSFTAVALEEAASELAAYYQVNIQFSVSRNHIYTGLFPRSVTVEEALHLLCKPFDLRFVKIADNHYEIRENP